VDDLKEMDEEEKTRNIALHNLWQTLTEMKRIRQAIKHGTLWELAEQRAACHPSLQEAMEVIAGEKKWLEKWENISKKRAFIYTGRFSMHRPIAYRLRKRVMERYIPFFDKSVIFAEMEKPYSSKNEWMKKLEANCIIETPFGAIPLELDEIYPVAQSVFPLETDEESRKMAARMCSRFYRKLKIVSLNEIERKSEDYDIRKIKSIANYQFGKGAGDALFDGKIGIRKSKTTGKIRNVYCNGKHVVSIRASDGFFTLKAEGGRRLHRFFSYPKMRVVVGDEAEPFIKEGRNVFAKFVVDACREIRPYDEVLIVSKEDELLAVGQCLMNRDEMLDFERGVAVKTREVCN